MQAPGRTPYRADPMRAPVPATTPSHIQLQSQSPTARSPLRRRPSACVRCRRRKVRCDGAVPACSNCAKAGEECFEGRAASAVSRSRLQYLENRVRELEGHGDNTLMPQTPELSENNRSVLPADTQTINPPAGVSVAGNGPISHGQTQTPVAESPANSLSSQITRHQPLAHEVGLLSLSNTTDPKYLGPSSGITFARLIYESAPQSQGLPLSFLREQEQEQQQQQHDIVNQKRTALAADIPSINLPPPADCQQYADAFFDATPFFPFISQDAFYHLLDQAQQFNETSKWNSLLPIRLASAQLLLILSLGARFLETRLGADYSSSALFLSGMEHCAHLNLPESVEGVQVLLLMVLHSFYNPEGLNAWYLLHTIIASCLDLGLQRRDSNGRDRTQLVRSAVFWSAYSMDRTLTTILGRPLTLRDEAIDQSFPSLESSDEVEEAATQWHQYNTQPDKQAQETIKAPYIACIYSLRFDRIVAEIKLMIYRVSRSPRRFPWPTNLDSWQQEAEASCVKLLSEIRTYQRGRPRSETNSLSGTTVQRLELKYHQCIMLLYRPSPQLPHPKPNAIQACFNSAMAIIQIQGDLHRFSNMECSWLSAHSIFVAAITMLYCLWTYPAVWGATPLSECLSRAEMALQLLTFLSQWWSVALEPCQKLSHLISLTHERSHGGLGSFTDLGSGSSLQQAGPEMINYVPQDDGRSLLIDELGILRDLFDLGWLNDWGLDTAPPAWDSDQLMADFESGGHDTMG